MVGAAKEVIDGHGGIWQAPFLLFIASLVFQHVQASKSGPSGAEKRAAPSPGMESTARREAAKPADDLAEFAKSLPPIKMPQR
jgi:hypothetical protein